MSTTESTADTQSQIFKEIDIFKALRKLKSDELLPENGVYEFFYQNATYPGVSLFLRHKKKIKLFYVDHDDIILEIKDQVPEWNVAMDKDLVRISFIYNIHGASIFINFVFDMTKENYRELLEVFRKTKEIKLYYMTILYGGIVFDSYQKFKIPSKIRDFLKKVK